MQKLGCLGLIFSRLHDYSENMKSRIDTLSIKGNMNIWWEDMKNFRGIRGEDLTWSGFERLFKKNIYLKDTMMTGKMCYMS